MFFDWKYFDRNRSKIYFLVSVSILALLLGWGWFSVNQYSRNPHAQALEELDFLMDTVGPAKKAVDVWGLDLYLKHRAVEMRVPSEAPLKSWMAFEYAQTMISLASPARKASDLKLLFHRLYIDRLFLLSQFERNIRKLLKKMGPQQEVISVSKRGKRIVPLSHLPALFESIKELQNLEKKLMYEDLVKAYEGILEKEELEALWPYLWLRLAFIHYETNPKASLSALKKLRKTKIPYPTYLTKIAQYIEDKARKSSGRLKRLEKKQASLLKQAEQIGIERAYFQNIERAFQYGFFSKGQQWLEEKPISEDKGGLKPDWRRLRRAFVFNGRGQDFSKEPSSSLGELKDTQEDLMDIYLSMLMKIHDKNYLEFSESASKLARHFSGHPMTALLRYQAWAVAYYDAKNLKVARKYLADLKRYHPLDLLSRPEMGKTLFRRYIEPGIWGVFKEHWDTITTVRVLEGTVYVLERTVDLLWVFRGILSAGESMTIGQKEAIIEASKKRAGGFGLNLLRKTLPLAVGTFKRNILKIAKDVGGEVFEKLYTEGEFDEFVIRKMKKKLPPIISNIKVKLHKEGFDGFMQFKMFKLKIEMTGSGIIYVNEGEADPEQELILKAYWIKVGPFMVPEFFLRRIERDFADAIKQDTFPLKIIEMEYREGGILIKLQKVQDGDSGGASGGLEEDFRALRGEYAY